MAPFKHFLKILYVPSVMLVKSHYLFIGIFYLLYNMTLEELISLRHQPLCVSNGMLSVLWSVRGHWYLSIQNKPWRRNLLTDAGRSNRVTNISCDKRYASWIQCSIQVPPYTLRRWICVNKNAWNILSERWCTYCKIMPYLCFDSKYKIKIKNEV